MCVNMNVIVCSDKASRLVPDKDKQKISTMSIFIIFNIDYEHIGMRVGMCVDMFTRMCDNICKDIYVVKCAR